MLPFIISYPNVQEQNIFYVSFNDTSFKSYNFILVEFLFFQSDCFINKKKMALNQSINVIFEIYSFKYFRFINM